MTQATIDVEHVSKSFGGTIALDDISLRVAPGQVLALLAPNGAGKTTLVRVLTTLLRPDGGSARIAGYDVQRNAKDVRALIGRDGGWRATSVKSDDWRKDQRANRGRVPYHLMMRSRTDSFTLT